jgi:preprotein translocase subunit YajC
MVAWLAALIIAVVVTAVSYVMMPRPKTGQPQSTQELDEPVASAGKPVTVVFGTATVKELNCLYYGDKSIRTYQVKV